MFSVVVLGSHEKSNYLNVHIDYNVSFLKLCNGICGEHPSMAAMGTIHNSSRMIRVCWVVLVTVFFAHSVHVSVCELFFILNKWGVCAKHRCKRNAMKQLPQDLRHKI